MILKIIQILLISLGFGGNNQYNQPRSLQRQTQPRPMQFRNPIAMILLFAIGIILFTLFVFMFMPGTESGIVYNNFDRMI